MTGENDSYIKGDVIMLSQREMTIKRKRLAELHRNQEIAEMKHEQLQRLASESESTDNAYNEDYKTKDKWIETGNYDSIIMMKKCDSPNIYQRPKYLFDVGKETDHEFNKRQYSILKKLRQKQIMEDEKYV